MSAGVKLGLYALVLAVMIGLGAVVGTAVGPIAVGGGSESEMHDMGEP